MHLLVTPDVDVVAKTDNLPRIFTEVATTWTRAFVTDRVSTGGNAIAPVRPSVRLFLH